LLGLSPQLVLSKLDSLQRELQLPSHKAAVDVVVAFPQLLGLNSATLAAKWRRLQGLAQRNALWQQQLSELLQRPGAGCLGRVLAAGPGVVDRLQYVLDAQSVLGTQSAGAGHSGRSSSSSSSGGNSRGGNSRSRTSTQTSAEMSGVRAGAAAATSDSAIAAHVHRTAGARVKSKGELRLTSLLLQSETAFTARHPEFVLWRLNQRSRQATSSSSSSV
jgi:hypothetical protein